MSTYASLSSIIEYYGRNTCKTPLALSAASPMARFAVESSEHGCPLPNVRVRCRLDNAALYAYQNNGQNFTTNFEDNIFLKQNTHSMDTFEEFMDMEEEERSLQKQQQQQENATTVEANDNKNDNKEKEEKEKEKEKEKEAAAPTETLEPFEIREEYTGFCQEPLTPKDASLPEGSKTDPTSTNTAVEQDVSTNPSEKPLTKESCGPTASHASTSEEDENIESPGVYRRITLYGNNGNRLPEMLPYMQWWLLRGPLPVPLVVIAVGLTGTLHLYEMQVLRHLHSSVQLNCSTVSRILMNEGQEERELAAAGEANSGEIIDYGPDAFGKQNKIVELVMSECADLKDTRFLVHFPRLQKLDGSFVQLNANFNQSFSQCRRLRDLILVFCKGEGTRELPGLTACPKLKLLHLSNSNIQSLPPQLGQYCTRLTKVDLSYCRALQDFTPLATLAQTLRVLNLGGDSQIESIDFLKDCKHLEVLCLSSCRGLRSVEVCENLRELRDLDCSYSAVYHIGALSTLPKLCKVDFRTCSLSPSSIEELEKMEVSYVHIGRRAFSTSASSFNSNSTSEEEGDDGDDDDDW